MKTSEMKVIELSGSPRNRGHIYGESARDSIGVCMEQYADDFCRTNDANLVEGAILSSVPVICLPEEAVETFFKSGEMIHINGDNGSIYKE